MEKNNGTPAVTFAEEETCPFYTAFCVNLHIIYRYAFHMIMVLCHLRFIMWDLEFPLLRGTSKRMGTEKKTRIQGVLNFKWGPKDILPRKDLDLEGTNI